MRSMEVIRAERMLRDALRARRWTVALVVTVAGFATYLAWGTTKGVQALVACAASIIVGMIVFAYHDMATMTVVEARDALEDARQRQVDELLGGDA